jgi:hypothetical protein
LPRVTRKPSALVNRGGDALALDDQPGITHHQRRLDAGQHMIDGAYPRLGLRSHMHGHIILAQVFEAVVADVEQTGQADHRAGVDGGPARDGGDEIEGGERLFQQVGDSRQEDRRIRRRRDGAQRAIDIGKQAQRAQRQHGAQPVADGIRRREGFLDGHGRLPRYAGYYWL